MALTKEPLVGSSYSTRTKSNNVSKTFASPTDINKNELKHQTF